MIAPIDGDWAYPPPYDDLLAALARERLHNPWWTT